MNWIQQRWWARWTLNIAIVCLVFYGVTTYHEYDLLKDDQTVPAPAFSLVSLQGETLTSEQLKGKDTLLYFFAPWCAVCDVSADSVENLRQQVKQERLNVVMIALAYDHPQQVRDFIQRHDLTVTTLLGTSHTSQAYRISAFPTYYVLDSDGMVVNRSTGLNLSWGMLWKLGYLVDYLIG